MKKEMVIFIGIQGSGKTTCYEKLFSKNYEHINLDKLRTRNNEQRKLKECFESELSMVIDNTNPAKADREKYITQARANGYRTVGYFFESKVQTCIARNERRTGEAKVPVKAIVGTSNRLQLPEYSEGFDELCFIRYEKDEILIEKWRA